jgi:3-dehydroquinate dehydratase-2
VARSEWLEAVRLHMPTSIPPVRIDVLNGVNLDILGRRDRARYGDDSLQDLETQVYAWARELGLQVRCRQTNHEGEYVEFLHAALDNADALVVNPAAWTHYSWAIRDALEPFSGPVVEVHLSDVDAREDWRRFSVLEGLTTDRIAGEGINGYRRALQVLAERRDG